MAEHPKPRKPASQQASKPAQFHRPHNRILPVGLDGTPVNLSGVVLWGGLVLKWVGWKLPSSVPRLLYERWVAGLRISLRSSLCVLCPPIKPAASWEPRPWGVWFGCLGLPFPVFQSTPQHHLRGVLSTDYSAQLKAPARCCSCCRLRSLALQLNTPQSHIDRWGCLSLARHTQADQILYWAPTIRTHPPIHHSCQNPAVVFLTPLGGTCLPH